MRKRILHSAVTFFLLFLLLVSSSALQIDGGALEKDGDEL
jgi:hypothetical protein